MKDVETLIFSRLTGDTGSGSLESLLGGSGRIRCGYQQGAALSPSLVFWMFTGGPGLVRPDRAFTFEDFYQFDVFSNSHPDITFRLKRLFDGHCFDDSGLSEVGGISSVFDWEGPDGFDEALEVMRKSVRFRFFSAIAAQNPI